MEHVVTNNKLQPTCDTRNAPAMLGKINPNRKYAVFATSSGINRVSFDFNFLLPLTALAWKRIGFDSVVIIVDSVKAWSTDPLRYSVLTSLNRLDAVVVFLQVRPVNSVMVSQVRTTFLNFSLCL